MRARPARTSRRARLAVALALLLGPVALSVAGAIHFNVTHARLGQLLVDLSEAERAVLGAVQELERSGTVSTASAGELGARLRAVRTHPVYETVREPVSANGLTAPVAPGPDREALQQVLEWLFATEHRVAHGLDAASVRAMASSGLAMLFLALAAIGVASLERRQGRRLSEQVSSLHREDVLQRAMIDGQSELVCRFDRDGVIRYANIAYGAFFGRTPSELVGTAVLDLVPESERATLSEAFERLAREGGRMQTLHPLVRADGETRWVEWTNRRLPSLEGECPEIQSVGRDQTVPQRHETRLRRQESHAHTLASLSRRLLAQPLPSPEDLCRLVLEDALVLTGSAAGRVVLLDASGRETAGFGALEASCCPAAWAWVQERRAPLLSNAPGTDARSEAEGPSPLLLVPAVADGQLGGVLAVANAARAYDELDLAAAEGLADLLGLALARRQTTAALTESEARYRILVQQATEAITLIDPVSLRYLHANPRAATMFGLSPDEMLRTTPGALSPPQQRDGRDSEAAARAYVEAAVGGEVVEFEWVHRHKDGRRIDCEIHLVRVPLDGRDVVRASVLDVTARRLAEARIAHLAYHDTVTELPNRALFLERLGASLRAARRTGRAVAVLMLDLDHFKAVNDAHGHPVGDALLAAVGRRLATVVRASDTVARLGGDEFAVLLEDVRDPVGPAVLAQKLIAALARPFDLEELELRTGTSVGIAIAPPGSDTDRVLREADVALYSVKSAGRGRYAFHTEEMGARVAERLRLAEALARALERDELELAWLPVVELDGRRVVALEALARWRGPDGEPVPPEVFVPIAEERGLMPAIGRWVLTRACREAADWVARRLPFDRISVNLSPVQLGGPELVDEVRDILAATGLSAGRLRLEVPERALGDPQAIEATIRALARAGVSFAIDDFGTGISSIAHLKRLELRELKIDRALIQRLPDSAGDLAVVEALLAVGDALGIATTAEGIETGAQLDTVRGLGCRFGQGFRFSTPLQSGAVPGFLRARVAPQAPAAIG